MKIKFMEDISDYIWESTLEEEIAEYYAFNCILNESHRDKNNIMPGDVVFVQLPNEGDHRILVITKINNNEFEGCLLSSRIDKANINNKKYPHNIFIRNYNSILDGNENISNRSIIVKTDSLIRFNLDQIESNSGWFKGRVSKEFFDFISICIENAKNNNISGNKDKTW